LSKWPWNDKFSDLIFRRQMKKQNVFISMGCGLPLWLRDWKLIISDIFLNMFSQYFADIWSTNFYTIFCDHQKSYICAMWNVWCFPIVDQNFYLGPKMSTFDQKCLFFTTNVHFLQKCLLFTKNVYIRAKMFIFDQKCIFLLKMSIFI